MADPFSPYYNELHAYASKRLGCIDTAADVVHDAFARAYRQSDPASIAQPRAFLYRILINLIHDRSRRSGRAFRIFSDEVVEETEAPSSELTPAEALASNETALRLQLAIESLPPRCREVFSLHRLSGLSHREIAERLIISQSTVEKHIATALIHLRRELADLFSNPD